MLIKRDASPEAPVVDGQQQLTTLTLLLSAVRATVRDTAVQSGITKRIYEHGDVVSATQARYRYCCASATETSFGNITEGVVLFFEKLALSIGQVDGSSGG